MNITAHLTHSHLQIPEIAVFPAAIAKFVMKNIAYFNTKFKSISLCLTTYKYTSTLIGQWHAIRPRPTLSFGIRKSECEK